jgi:uridine kinase
MPWTADAATLGARILRTAPAVGAVRLVCVDGPAGSGKTTLAAAVAATLEPLVGVVPVVHGDELYEGWLVVAGAGDRVDAFAALAERVDQLLLTPWSRGEAAAHPVWDWYAGSWGPSRTVEPAPVVLLEGVGLAAASLRARAALAVWVEADQAVRLARVLERDGDALRAEMLRWQADEQRWFERDGTRSGCDVRLTGDARAG